MTEPTKAAPPQGGMSSGLLTSLLGSLPGLVLGLASAGPWGVAAMAGGSALIALAIRSLLQYFNRSLDKRDQANAGGDAGETAGDLANQAHDVREGLDELSKKDPPNAS